MPAPTTAILDNFNRADNESLGSNFDVPSTYLSPEIVGDAAAGDDEVGGTSFALWATPFARDQEAYLTIQGINLSEGDSLYLMVRVDADDPETESSYTAQIGPYFIDLESPYSDPVIYDVVVQNGDAVWLKALGNTVLVYYKPSGGEWQLILSKTENDPRGAEARQIGFKISDLNQTLLIDDFGGGDVEAAPPEPPAPEILDAIVLRVQGHHREVLEGIQHIGEDERITLALDFSKFGDIQTFGDITLWLGSVDVSATNLVGDARIVGSFLILPTIYGLLRGGEYRLEAQASVGGQYLEPYVLILGEE
ncbi:MAG TPA: hypothetical protein VJG32_17975 [Anaerolineae bacterium]|nr:hypothetical protein [Anaerolineae bacterium]